MMPESKIQTRDSQRFEADATDGAGDDAALQTPLRRSCNPVMLDETYWGYIVRSNARPRSSAILMQWLSGFVGVSLVASAIGFWVVPGSAFSPDLALMKYVISAALASFGVLLVWYASQGTCYELQVDVAHNELREAVRNKKGQVRLLSRVPFQEIGSVCIDRSAGREGTDVPLLLRYRDTAQVIEVARACEYELVDLRDRLARDILGMSALRKRQQDALKRRHAPRRAQGPANVGTAA